MPTKTLLVEIRCEELPPAQVNVLAQRFPQQLLTALRNAGFAADDSASATNDAGEPLQLATPRRFAALLTGICATAATATFCRRGPLLAACYDEQQAPTKALRGFMQTVGASTRDPLIEITDKGRTYVAFNETRGGERLADTLAGIVQTVLLAANAPRLMRWGDNDFKFIRPLRGVLMLHGSNVLAGNVLGIAAGSTSSGHPALAPAALAIAAADEYTQTLANDGKVIADISQRQRAITAQFNGSAPQPAHLLDEVTAMCEQPTVYAGALDDAFLALPSFCVEECMIKHQRAFPVYDNNTLTAAYRFIADNQPPAPENMINGMNTVLRARLRDVEFYFAEDSKLSLAEALARLENVVYHRQLGSQRARVQRLIAIADAIGKQLQLNADSQQQLQQAATICKSDLSTLMIREYPKLEGLMAATYFCRDNPAVAALVSCHNSRDWHTATTTAADPQPVTALLLAVQLEKLIGMFAVGEKPSGNKDPHGLRAAAATTADLLSTCRRALALDNLLAAAAAAFGDNLTTDTSEIWHFIAERKRQQLLEQGYGAAVLNAVLAQPQPYLIDIEEKAAALTDFLRLAQAAALIEAQKRIGNILRKSVADTLPAIDTALFTESAEHDLYKCLCRWQHDNNAAAHNDYPAILASTASMHGAVRAFFEQVLVNADDAQVRGNRLALLDALRTAFNTVGDLSKLSGG